MITYSVVISTYNRANLLRQCLDALSNQSVPVSAYEIIVINDGSADNTAEIVRDCQTHHPDLNIVYKKQTNGGPSKGRNAGIALAKGDIIFFTDDDCIVPKRWIETLAEGYKKHPDVAGVGGLYVFPDYIKNNFIFAEYHLFKMRNAWYGLCGLNHEIKTSAYSKNPAGNTSNMSYIKDVFESLGGFDENLTRPGFDDTELRKRVMDSGRILLYIPYHVIHLHPMGSFSAIKRFFIFGRGRYYFSKKGNDLKKHYPSLAWLNEPIQKHPDWKPHFKALAYIDLLITTGGWCFEAIVRKFNS